MVASNITTQRGVSIRGCAIGFGEKIGRILLAFVLAALLVPVNSFQIAHAAEKTIYYGEVVDAQRTDENGFPLYKEDGSPDMHKTASVVRIKNAPEHLVIPEKAQIIGVSREAGYPETGEVFEDVTIANLSVGMRGDETSYASITSVDVSQNTSLQSIGFSAMENLSNVTFGESEKLVSLTLSECPLITSIDVSKCKGLSALSLSNCGLTKLDVTSIPESVKSFTCVCNEIEDTNALIERFGEDKVLPQTWNAVKVFPDHTTNNYYVGGTEVVLSPQFVPARRESSRMYTQETSPTKYLKQNYTVTSSDPTVVSATLRGIPSSDNAEILFSFLKAGTATITTTYDFQGEYGRYRATSSVPVTVASKKNPIVSMAFDSQKLEFEQVTVCPLCSQPHGSGLVAAKLSITPDNPSLSYTNSFRTSLDYSSDMIQSSMVSQGLNTTTYDFSSAKVGNSKITATALEGEREICKAVIDAAVTEASLPQLKVNNKRELEVGWATLVAFGMGQGGSSGGYEPLARYDDTTYPGFTSHPYSRFLESVESSNPEVVPINPNHDGTVATSIYLAKAGVTTLTIKDKFGNVGTCELTVKDKAKPEILCDSSDITIKQGETFKLLDRISGTNWEKWGMQFNPVDGNIAAVKKYASLGLAYPADTFELLGRNVGETNLIVSYQEDNSASLYVAEIKVKVIPGEKPAVPVEKVTLGKVQTAMQVGTTQSLSAEIAPHDATEKTVTWTSSDKNILSVSSAGVVTAVGNGSAAITATAGGKSATSEAIVVTTPVTGVSLDTDTLSLYIGAKASKLSASVVPSNASKKQVTWLSSDPLVATVDASGNVAPVAVGETIITATSSDGGFVATCSVVVGQHAQGVVLDKKALVLSGAETAELKATVAPDNATNKNVSWTSADPSVVLVDSEGVLTAVSKGTADIVVTTEDGAYQARCQVEVKNPAVKIVLEQDQVDLKKGETTKLEAVISGELLGEVDDSTLTWSSSDEIVAKVSEEGLVSALKTGRATVTVKLSNGQAATTEIVATMEVVVTNPVAQVQIDQAAIDTRLGDQTTFKLNATVAPSDADEATVLWSSSQPTVATVDAAGVVSILSAGTAEITAVTANGTKAMCRVNVAAAPLTSTEDGSAVVEANDSVALEAVRAKEQEVGPLTLVVEPQSALDTVTKAIVDRVVVGSTHMAGVFDIRFVDEKGGAIAWGKDEASGTLRLKIKLQGDLANFTQDTLQVYYLDKDKDEPAKLTCWVEDGYLVFLTPHFSEYLVAGELSPASALPSEKNEQAVIKQKDVSGSSLAPTGDTAMGDVGGLVLCVLLASVGALWARRTGTRS